MDKEPPMSKTDFDKMLANKRRQHRRQKQKCLYKELSEDTLNRILNVNEGDTFEDFVLSRQKRLKIIEILNSTFADLEKEIIDRAEYRSFLIIDKMASKELDKAYKAMDKMTDYFYSVKLNIEDYSDIIVKNVLQNHIWNDKNIQSVIDKIIKERSAHSCD